MALELVHSTPLDLVDAEPRADHAVISRMVSEGAKVLEIGCGDGALISLLARERKAQARGLERDQRRVNACVARGLSVVQADPERDLAAFPGGSFDFVILAHTLQKQSNPRMVLKQAARIGERVIVSVANFAHWRARLALMHGGRVKGPATTPARWCDSDITHPCSIRDVAELADEMHLAIERALPISGGHSGAPFAKTRWRANWFAEEAVFLLVQT